MRRLYTIGYEGAALASFIETLKLAKIDLLLDVRELAASRRPGFSKTALRTALHDAGIDYRHERTLGTPRPLRHRLRADHDYPRYFREFAHHLRGESELLGQLAAQLKGNVALMCFERDHTVCHRHMVADALGELADKPPVHLYVAMPDEPPVKRRSRRRKTSE